MVKIKSYTDINQCKKLKDILQLKSADMCYRIVAYNPNDTHEYQPYCFSGTLESDIPCWSLAALRNCLPSGICIDDILYVFESHNTFDNMWVYEYKFEDISAPLYSKSSNEIDACVEMIIKLYEQKFI